MSPQLPLSSSKSEIASFSHFVSCVRNIFQLISSPTSVFLGHRAEGLYTLSTVRWPLAPFPQSPVMGPGAEGQGVGQGTIDGVGESGGRGMVGGEGTGAWLPCGPCRPLCTAALVAFLVFHQAMCSLRPISQGLCKCGFLLHLQVSESGLSARKLSLSPGPGQSLVLCSHSLWVLSLTAFLSIYNCISPAWSSEPNCLPHWSVNSPRTERDPDCSCSSLSFPYSSSI